MGNSNNSDYTNLTSFVSGFKSKRFTVVRPC